MPEPRPAIALRNAPLIHGALLISSIFTIGLFWFLRGGIPIALVPGSRSLLAYLAYGNAVAVLIVVAAIRSRIPAFDRGGDLDGWWRANRVKVTIVWMIGEGTCVLGAVFWFLTDNQLVLVVLAGVGLAVLAAHQPSKLFSTM